jgi:hypothetical protein
MPALDWLNDAADARVIEALTTKCGICHAAPDIPCRHPWQTTEPLGRIVHQSRAEAFMDKRPRRGATH